MRPPAQAIRERGTVSAMAIGTERRPARAGTGSCTKCTCSRFEGHGSICENCKHHYDEHNVAWLRFELARHRAYRAMVAGDGPRFACGGYTDGTSGGRWVTHFDQRTRTGPSLG